MIVRMKDFGTSLVTRVAGRQAFDDIMASTNGLSEKTTFDFDGVSLVTNSFADETFGRIALERGIDGMRSCTAFVNVTPFIARVIRNAIDERTKSHDA